MGRVEGKWGWSQGSGKVGKEEHEEREKELTRKKQEEGGKRWERRKSWNVREREEEA